MMAGRPRSIKNWRARGFFLFKSAALTRLLTRHRLPGAFLGFAARVVIHFRTAKVDSMESSNSSEVRPRPLD